MAASLESLQAQVLSLSKADRSRLLERLIASLDVDVAEEDWERVAEARDAELERNARGRMGFPTADFPYTVIDRQRPTGIRILVVKHDRRRPSNGGSRR